jgi:hypothetical protein
MRWVGTNKALFPVTVPAVVGLLGQLTSFNPPAPPVQESGTLNEAPGLTVIACEVVVSRRVSA